MDGSSRTVDNAVVHRRTVGDDVGPGRDGSWNLSFGVNNHLVLFTATALFAVYVAASLMLIVWRWRGCLVRIHQKIAVFSIISW